MACVPELTALIERVSSGSVGGGGKVNSELEFAGCKEAISVLELILALMKSNAGGCKWLS